MSVRRATLVTGGAGFIGSNYVRRALRDQARTVVVLDKLTYAGNEQRLDEVRANPRFVFVRGDVAHRALISRVLREHELDSVVHCAAETHVDRSIDGPAEFVHTNILGTFELLEATLEYLSERPSLRERFRFVHVSTDEVYGALSENEPPFTERSTFAPNSPYAASKASADHLVRAFEKTYGLPAIITRCSNNYGPYQHPEKLVPQLVLRAIEAEPLLVYGDGQHVRDWIHVDDHCDALEAALERGRVGAQYNIGAGCEQTNESLVEFVCQSLEAALPARDNERMRARGWTEYRALRELVADRPGHDRRYALDAALAREELGWAPKRAFGEAMSETVRWCVSHRSWCDEVLRGARVPERLGLARTEPSR